MNRRGNFYRKVTYGVAIAALLFPLSLLSAPATVESPGGTLARLRTENGLGQADLGEIDPASETIKLATLGLRGVAVNLLWDKATHYKKVEDWTNLAATLEQLAKLQPNFITFWKYQSWNLSYNVSVEFDDFRDRYYWVRRGIQFLRKGVTLNRDSPVLLWELGWVLGQKIGRADETEQYRRLFKADDEYHPEDRTPSERDNWLVGKASYLDAVAAVDERGKSLGKKSPSIFYSSPSKSQMNYSAAIGEEGLFERSVRGWGEAEDEWREFGNLPIEHSTGPILRFNREPELEAEVEQLKGELNALLDGVEEIVVAEARAALTDEQRAALDTPIGDRTPEVAQVAYEAERALRVTPEKLAERIAREEPAKRREAAELAADLRDTEKLLRFTDAYKDTTNYDYWALRCEFEQTAEAVAARELIFRAERAFKEETDPFTAKDLYEQSFDRWAALFEKYPSLIDGDNTTGDDVMFYLADYKKVLEQLDEQIADDFPLWGVIERYDSEANFRVELAERAERGLRSGAAVAPPGSAAEPPVEEPTPPSEADPQADPQAAEATAAGDSPEAAAAENAAVDAADGGAASGDGRAVR
ncbi:MAG: hypothetical protein AAF805_02990 [Planctomycetota bacterium]